VFSFGLFHARTVRIFKSVSRKKVVGFFPKRREHHARSIGVFVFFDITKNVSQILPLVSFCRAVEHLISRFKTFFVILVVFVLGHAVVVFIWVPVEL